MKGVFPKKKGKQERKKKTRAPHTRIKKSLPDQRQKEHHRTRGVP